MTTTPNPLTPAKPDPTVSNIIIPTAIPSDYLSLGVESGYNPPPASMLRMFILGPAGSGKTTFVAGQAKTLILDTERGASGILASRAHRLKISTYAQLERIRQKLMTDSKLPARPYDRIVIDGIGGLTEIVNTQLVEEVNSREGKGREIDDIATYGQKGAGWSMLRKRAWSFIQDLETSGYTWTIIDHTTEKTISTRDSEITVIRPVIFDTFSKTISRSADITCNIYSKLQAEPTYTVYQGRKIQSGTTTRTAYILDCSTDFKSAETSPGKMRNVPSMVTKIELPDASDYTIVGWDCFEKEYNNVVAETKKKLGIA